jgi:hypothetical protein
MHGPGSAFSKHLDLDPAHEYVKKRRGRSQMEAWRAYIPVVADSHHSDEEQEHDLDSHRIRI